MNLTVHLLTRAVLTVVAGRGDDDHSLIDELANRDAERIICVRVDGRHTETEVRDANVVVCAISQQPIEGRENA